MVLTFVATPGTKACLEDPKFRADVIEHRRTASPRPAHGRSRAVVFLASPAASLITGDTILIDGGWTTR